MDEIGIIETKTDSLVQRCQSVGLPFLGASQLAFSPDGTTLAVANQVGVHLLVLAQDKELSEVVRFRDKWIDAIHWADCDSLIIVSDRGIRQYDKSGKFMRSFTLRHPVLACAVSHDGTVLAASTDSEVIVFEVSSGNRLQSHRIDFATSLAFAPQAKHLAIGDGRGSLTVLDIDSGQTMWTTTVAGRYRWSWTVPVAALFVWFYVAYRMSKAAMARANGF
jgi:WD40 repeat protein